MDTDMLVTYLKLKPTVVKIYLVSIVGQAFYLFCIHVFILLKFQQLSVLGIPILIFRRKIGLLSNEEQNCRLGNSLENQGSEFKSSDFKSYAFFLLFYSSIK